MKGKGKQRFCLQIYTLSACKSVELELWRGREKNRISENGGCEYET